MDTILTITTRPHDLAGYALTLHEAAQRGTFATYQQRRPAATKRAQGAALASFRECLALQGYTVGDLFSDPQNWTGITSEMILAFREWLLLQSFAMGTVNLYVSSCKTYMTLANAAGAIPDSEIIRLQGPALKSYSRKEAVDMDAKRKGEGMETRKGAKKTAATAITEKQIRALCKVRNDSPQARRDALIMTLLFSHGMRVSEVADLLIEDINREERQITFYRRKTGKTSRHKVSEWRGLAEYLERDNRAAQGPLILASNKSGSLIQGAGMSTRAINERVGELGRAAGIEHLSPHDLRHAGASTLGSDPNTSLQSLMNWGGWSSAQIAARYMARDVDSAGIALGDELQAL
jgi:integrase